LTRKPVKSRPAVRLHNSLVNVVVLMKELLRTNDPVRLSWLRALLKDSGIGSLVFDDHTSLVEGSIGAIPRRLMVAERDYPRARELLATSDAEEK
jgi:hypothetical protein